MSVGTKLLVKVFEIFTKDNTSHKIFRRLYCESGQAAKKAYRYANNNTKQNLDEIIPKCKDCKHSKIQPRTIVLVFEELTKNNHLKLLYELYVQIGGPSRKAYRLCNQKTQSTIQKIGLQEMYVKKKPLHIKK